MSKLTRFLYEAEEVESAFIFSMINKINIKECYYWLFELYYSKIDVFPVIWKLYLDYYAIFNPKMENYIIKRHKLWKKDNSIDHICYVVKNLHVLKLNYDVFMLRQLCQQKDLHVTSINRGRYATWTRSFKKEHIKLLTCINKRQFNNICYYLVELFKNGCDLKELHKDLCLYYARERGYDLHDEERKSELIKNIEKSWETKVKHNCFHYLLTIICQMNVLDEDIQDQKLFIVPNKEDIDEIITRYNDVVRPVYRTLQKKRCYNIDESIGLYNNLIRFGFENQDKYKEEIRDHWEYYAYRTPYWREIIDKCGGIADDEMREIKFPNDEKSEEFYDLYGYELDEQPIEVQNMGFLPIRKIDYTEMLEGVDSLIVYPENFELFK